MAYDQVPYRPMQQMGGSTPAGAPAPNPRDGITAALMNVNNPQPGYLQPPGVPGINQISPPPFGGIPGGAQPAASLGPAQPPLGAMGPIGGPLTPGLNLPGVNQPGALPQGMQPQNVLGGMPQQQPRIA